MLIIEEDQECEALWDQSRLLETIEALNADDDVRELVRAIREDRREIMASQSISLTTLCNCCTIQEEELDDLFKSKLESDWDNYSRALQFYNECLSFEDLERVPEDKASMT